MLAFDSYCLKWSSQTAQINIYHLIFHYILLRTDLEFYQISANLTKLLCAVEFALLFSSLHADILQNLVLTLFSPGFGYINSG